MNRLTSALAALPLLALGACSQVQDAASDAASDAGTRAGCAVAGTAIDEGRSIVSGIASDLGADPDAARAKLTAARAALQAAERGLGDEARTQVDRAVEALDTLRSQARSVADGSSVDDAVVREAQAEYDAAAQQVAGIC